MVIAPRRPERVYVAGASGVYRSEDAGRTWEPAGEGLQDLSIAGLTLDPANPDRVFAGTADGKLFQSDNAGRSWRPLAS